MTRINTHTHKEKHHAGYISTLTLTPATQRLSPQTQTAGSRNAAKNLMQSRSHERSPKRGAAPRQTEVRRTRQQDRNEQAAQIRIPWSVSWIHTLLHRPPSRKSGVTASHHHVCVYMCIRQTLTSQYTEMNTLLLFHCRSAGDKPESSFKGELKPRAMRPFITGRRGGETATPGEEELSQWTPTHRRPEEHEQHWNATFSRDLLSGLNCEPIKHCAVDWERDVREHRMKCKSLWTGLIDDSSAFTKKFSSRELPTCKMLNLL